MWATKVCSQIPIIHVPSQRSEFFISSQRSTLYTHLLREIQRHVCRSVHVASSYKIPLRSLTQQGRILLPFIKRLGYVALSLFIGDRPTEPLGWWAGDIILGGRDELGGGTWLGSTRDGRVAFLTNFREVESLPEPKTRGDLPLRFLQSKKSPQEFAEQIVEEAHVYNGFNLVCVDIYSSTMVYVFNRPKPGYFSVTPGIHVLTNAALDAPWPKAERLRHSFKELVDRYGENEFPIKEMVEQLMTNTIKDEDSKLPGIHPPERERPLSSIFVKEDLTRYGTRSTSALLAKSNKEVSFYEKYLDKEQWRENTVAYQINET